MNRLDRRATRSRSWPLRVLLLTILLSLITSGMFLAHTDHQASTPISQHPSTTSTSISKTSTTQSVTSIPTSTTLVARVTTTTMEKPIANPVVFSPPARGCNMHTAVTSIEPPVTETTSTSVTSTTDAPPPTSPPTLGHCTVLQIGDSVGNNLGYGLWNETATTPGLSLILKGKASTGLSNSWYYDWTAHLTDYLHQYRPHLVIISLGANDEQGMIVSGRAQQFPSSAWRAEYLKHVLTIDRLATKAGAQVLWVGMPIMGPSGYSDGMKLLNSIYAEAARQTPGVTYLSTWLVFSNHAGQYQASAYVNGAYSSLRHTDGIHFSSPGQAVLGTFATRQLAAIYHVPFIARSPASITGW